MALEQLENDIRRADEHQEGEHEEQVYVCGGSARHQLLRHSKKETRLFLLVSLPVLPIIVLDDRAVLPLDEVLERNGTALPVYVNLGQDLGHGIPRGLPPGTLQGFRDFAGP